MRARTVSKNSTAWNRPGNDWDREKVSAPARSAPICRSDPQDGVGRPEQREEPGASQLVLLSCCFPMMVTARAASP